MSGLVVPHPAQAVAIAAVTDRLPAEFGDVWVSATIPDNRRARMVRVTRSPGGGVPHHGVTDHANYVIEAWASNEIEAERLANTVAAVWRSLVGRWAAGAFIRYAKAAAPYPFPDESKQARWQFTGTLDIKVD